MPPPLDPVIRQAFKDAVAKHLATHGSTNWTPMLSLYPEIALATKWRIIREAKGGDIPKPELVTSRAKLIQKVKARPPDARKVEAREKGVEHIAKQLPAAPSPNYIARSGDVGLQNLDFVAEIHALYRDAGMLRSYAIALRENDAGETVEKIINPMAFDRSIARRADLLDTAIKAVQEVWDLRTMQNFYETIIEEIGKESPDCQRRIMQRLADLNARTGMTMAMRI